MYASLLTKKLYTGHSDRVGGVAWHPRATLSQGPDLVNLASGAGDMNVHLWSLNRLVPFDLLMLELL
jgi:U4/U6 small nuclear ribonucleoprotein PRP4